MNTVGTVPIREKVFAVHDALRREIEHTPVELHYCRRHNTSHKPHECTKDCSLVQDMHAS